MKRRAVLILIGIVTTIGVASWWIYTPSVSGPIQVTWHDGKTPLLVEGYIVDAAGNPVVGQEVVMQNSSGTEYATTDQHGNFSCRLHEPSMYRLNITNVGEVRWLKDLNELPVDSGVVFEIKIKREMPAATGI